MSRLLTFLMLLLTTGPLLRAEPLDRRQLPAAVTWFIHLDMDAAKASTVARALHEQWFNQSQANDVLSKVRESLGIDPTRDLRSLTLYGITFAPDHGILIIRGKVDQPRLEALLNKNAGHRTEVIDGYSLHFWDEPILRHDPDARVSSRAMAGAFFKDDMVVIGPDGQSVISALEVLGEKSASLSGDAPLAAPVARGTVIQAAAMGLAEARGLPIQSPILKQCESGLLMLGEQDGESFVSGRVVTQSNDTAAQIKSLIEGARAMAQLQASDNADIAHLLQPLQVSVEDKAVEVSWRLRSSELVKMIEAHQPRRLDASQPTPPKKDP